MSDRKPYRSFFWPVIFIAAGVIWLLARIDVIPTENLWILLQIWPVLIILAGLDILFARRLPAVGALLALLVAAGVVYLLLSGTTFNLEGKPELQTEMFEAKIEGADMARFELDLSVQDVVVDALTDSDNLVEAKVRHFGQVAFSVSGGQEKQIRLEQEAINSVFAWLLPQTQKEDFRWEISLSPEVPFDLDVDASTGRSELDLSEVQLEHLMFDASTGASEIILPDSSDDYDVEIQASTGSMRVILPEQGNLTLRIDGSTGQITFVAYEDGALQVEVKEGGTGNLTIPSWMSKTSGVADRDEGIYQTDDFESAANQIFVVIEDISTGNIVVE